MQYLTEEEQVQAASIRPTVFHFQNRCPAQGVTLERGRVSWCEERTIMLDSGSNMRMGTEVLLNKFDLWRHLRRVDFEVQTSVAGPQAIRGVVDELQEPLRVVLGKGTRGELTLELGTPAAPLYICKSSTVYTLLFDINMTVECMGYLDPLRADFTYRPFYRSKGDTATSYALPGDMYLPALDDAGCAAGVGCVAVVDEGQVPRESEGDEGISLEVAAEKVSAQAVPLPPEAAVGGDAGDSGTELQQQLPGSHAEHDAAVGPLRDELEIMQDWLNVIRWRIGAGEEEWAASICMLQELHAELDMVSAKDQRVREEQGRGTEGLPEQFSDITPEEDVQPPPWGTADPPFAVPPEWYRDFRHSWDDEPEEAVAEAPGVGAWTVPTRPPPAWQYMPLAYAMAREVLVTGRLVCAPQQVSSVVEAAEMLRVLVRGRLLGLYIPPAALTWLEDWCEKLMCQGIQTCGDGFPTFGFPFYLPPTVGPVVVEAARQVMEALCTPGTVSLHSAQALLELAEWWIRVGQPVVDGQGSYIACTPARTLHIGDQGSGVETLLVPLEAALPLCAYFHPNQFQLLVERTSVVQVPINVSSPTHAEGGELEEVVRPAKSKKLERKRSARCRLQSRGGAAAARWNRRRRSWTGASKRTQRVASEPTERRSKGPPARRVKKRRLPWAQKRRKHAALQARRVLGVQWELLKILAKFCGDPVSFVCPPPPAEPKGVVMVPKGFVRMPWEAETDRPVAADVPLMLWDVNGDVQPVGSVLGSDFGQRTWGVSQNRTSYPNLGFLCDLGDTWQDLYPRSDLTQLDQQQLG
jgi:hypothetical protein